MFQTWHREPVHVYSEHGSPVKVLYAPEFDKRGVMKLVESGREDLYAFIQSHKDSVDLHKIMERFQNGDVSVLQRVQGVFGDFSEMPKTYAELLNVTLEAESTFASLPLEIREKFGHSFQAWLAQAGTQDWLVAMGMVDTPEPVEQLPEPTQSEGE